MLQITTRYDIDTRLVEVTRQDMRAFAIMLGFDKPTTRQIRLPDRIAYTDFQRDLRSWQDGEFIQSALPYLTVCEREFLLSGNALDNLPEEE